jgi:chorismate mutase/prephenate dehydratase
VVNAGDDPVIKQFRDQISDNDLKIIDAINKRLKLVKQLRAYKEQHGVDFLDPAREEWMLTFVSRANNGPISKDGLAELYRGIVEITKREAAAQG